jgi:putative SOS response-associated peptidase YedK
MCGRYTLRTSPHELQDIFATPNAMDWSPRYNIAPTQTVVAVRQAQRAGNGADALGPDPVVGQRCEDRQQPD